MVERKKSTLIECPVCKGAGRIMPDALSIGARFRIEREKLNLTQAEMSVKVQIGRAQLANIEGDRSNPGLEVLVRLAKLSGCSTDYLLGVP